MSNYPEFFRTGFSNPLRELGSFQRSLDRWLDEARRGDHAPAFINPSCELTEDKGQYLAKFEMPGIPKEQIKIELQDNRLTVSAERKEERKEDGKKRHLSEFYYGSYMRSFELPTPVDAERVQAAYNEGVLSITIPKAETSRTRQITVR